MALDETVIDDGEFNMDELITFERPHSDHDYQVMKSFETSNVLTAAGYAELAVDEEWPPRQKKRMKVHFDYGDGKDYLPPIVKEENYENSYKKSAMQYAKLDVFNDNMELIIDKKMVADLRQNGLLSTGRKIGEFLDVMPPVPVKNEDLLIEEVDDYEPRNISEIKSFVVNDTSRSNI